MLGKDRNLFWLTVTERPWRIFAPWWKQSDCICSTFIQLLAHNNPVTRLKSTKKIVCTVLWKISLETAIHSLTGVFSSKKYRQYTASKLTPYTTTWQCVPPNTLKQVLHGKKKTKKKPPLGFRDVNFSDLPSQSPDYAHSVSHHSDSKGIRFHKNHPSLCHNDSTSTAWFWHSLAFLWHVFIAYSQTSLYFWLHFSKNWCYPISFTGL